MIRERRHCSGNLFSLAFLLLVPLGYLTGCLGFEAGMLSLGFSFVLFSPGIEVIEDAKDDGEGK
jgi:hypothetical protein